MSQYESHFSPYIELRGSSALGPAIPYARGLKTTKLEKREALNISTLLMSKHGGLFMTPVVTVSNNNVI